MAWNRQDRSGCNGMGGSGLEWMGMERRGCNGLDWNVPVRSRQERTHWIGSFRNGKERIGADVSDRKGGDGIGGDGTGCN